MGWGIHILYLFAPSQITNFHQFMRVGKLLRKGYAFQEGQEFVTFMRHLSCLRKTGKNFEHDTTLDKYVKKCEISQVTGT